MARFSFDVQPNTVQIIRNTMDNGTDVFVNVRAKGETRIFWTSDWDIERGEGSSAYELRFGEPTLADMYHYCMFDGDDMEPKWEAERKIAHELADKAWAEENLSPDGFVMVRPTANYENIYYSLRYIYDQPDTDIHNRVQRRH